MPSLNAVEILRLAMPLFLTVTQIKGDRFAAWLNVTHR
jgi:hypothetical protein